MDDRDIDKILEIKALGDKELRRLLQLAPDQMREKYRAELAGTLKRPGWFPLRRNAEPTSGELMKRVSELKAQLDYEARIKAEDDKAKRVLEEVVRQLRMALANISVPEQVFAIAPQRFYEWVRSDSYRTQLYEQGGPPPGLIEAFVRDTAEEVRRYYALLRKPDSPLVAEKQALKNAAYLRGRQWIDMSKIKDLPEYIGEPGAVVTVSGEPGTIVTIGPTGRIEEQPVAEPVARRYCLEEE